MFELFDELYENLAKMENEMNVVNGYIESDIFATDIFETEKKYGLEIEIPGYKKENINLTMDHEYLVVIVKPEDNKKKHFIRKENKRHNHENDYELERRYYVGSYQNEDLSATYEDGLLTVLLPKEVKKITDKKYINIK